MLEPYSRDKVGDQHKIHNIGKKSRQVIRACLGQDFDLDVEMGTMSDDHAD